MYPFIVKVEYWDDCQEPWILRHNHVILYAESMTEAISIVEHQHIFDNIETMKVSAAGDTGNVFSVPGHIAKILLAGSGDYRDGLLLTRHANISEKLRQDAALVEHNCHATIHEEE